MASVRMSGELRDKIFKNFEQQLYKVYEDNSGLQDLSLIHISEPTRPY